MEALLIEHKLNAWRYFFETGHCTSPANADSEWDVDVVISDAIDTGDNYLHQLAMLVQDMVDDHTHTDTPTTYPVPEREAQSLADLRAGWVARVSLGQSMGLAG